MAYFSFSLARPAETRISLVAAIVALVSPPRPKRMTAEQHLAAQMRREEARRAVDNLLR